MNHLCMTQHLQDTANASQRMDHLFMVINNLNQITKHMETNLSDAMYGLDQKLSFQLQVLGVKEDYPLDTVKDVLDRLDTTLDQVLMKIHVTSDEIMEFTKTKFAESSKTTLDVERDLKETMLLKNLELHLKMDSVLKQIKAYIDSFSNSKQDDCALGTISEGGAGAAVNEVRSETTKTYGGVGYWSHLGIWLSGIGGGGTPAQSSSQWLGGAD